MFSINKKIIDPNVKLGPLKQLNIILFLLYIVCGLYNVMHICSLDLLSIDLDDYLKITMYKDLFV